MSPSQVCNVPGERITCRSGPLFRLAVSIGTSVLLLALYAPLKLAEDVAVLDPQARGRRVDLGGAAVEEAFWPSAGPGATRERRRSAGALMGES